MKTVIEMAKQAGFDVLLPSEEVFGRGGVYTGSDDEISKYLERFAELVRADEREACAELCDKQADSAYWEGADACADAIRARGSNT